MGARTLARRAAAVAVPAVLVLAGCVAAPEGPPTVDLNRARLYPDIRALAQDSAAVVVGRVSDQQVTADIDPSVEFTLSSLEVTDVVAGDAAVGSTVVVRQFGAPGRAPPVPLLEQGSTYLLYLTVSGLPGPMAEQFYVTGSNAGLYAAGSGGMFVQMAREEGESLPAQIDRAQAAG